MNENRIRLMAWVWMPGADRTIFCEIDSAEAESRTACFSILIGSGGDARNVKTD